MQILRARATLSFLLLCSLLLLSHNASASGPQLVHLDSPLDLSRLLPSSAGVSSGEGGRAYRLTLDNGNASVATDIAELWPLRRAPSVSFCDLAAGVRLGAAIVVVLDPLAHEAVVEALLSDAVQVAPILFGSGHADLAEAGASPHHHLLAVRGFPPGAGDDGIALCGELGFTEQAPPFPPFGCSVPAARLRLQVVTSNLTLTLPHVAASPRGETDGSRDTRNTIEVLSGVPAVAEVPPTSLWCRGAPDGSGGPITAHVGGPTPRVPLLLRDVWGNPAHAVEPVICNVSGGSGGESDPATVIVSAAVPAAAAVAEGAWCGASGPLFLHAQATAAWRGQPTTRGRPDSPLWYSLRARLSSGIVLNGRSEWCLRVQLAPGAPHRLAIEVEQPVLLQGAHSFWSPRHLITFSSSTLIVAVQLMDSARNPLLGALLPCGTSSAPRCVSCRANSSIALEALPASDTADQAKARFRIPSAIARAGEELQVECRLADHALPQRNATERVVLNIVDEGEFDCIDERTPFGDVLSLISMENVDSVFFSSRSSEFPLAQVMIKLHEAGAERRSLTRPVSSLLQWVVAPRSGYLAIPLGLLSAFAFGAHYAKVSRVELELTKPLCDSLAFSQLQSAIAVWVHELGVNSTRFYSKLEVARPPSVEVSSTIHACHGNDMQALEFVRLSCCDDQGECRDSSTQTPLAITLLVAGILLGVAVAAVTHWYLRSTLQRTPVHLLSRHKMDMTSRTRVAFAHLLAPFVLVSHLYFIFDLANKSAAFLFYMDVIIPLLWFVAVGARFFFPLHVFTAPLYYLVGNLILSYSQFLLTNAVVWTASSLHLSIRLIPFLAASVLIVLQVFLTIRNASDELAPSILSPGIVAHSMIPVDAAMSLELFTITVMMFMFAVTWLEDITPFAAVVAAFVVVGYAALYNYSLSSQFQEAFKRHFGGDDQSGGGSSAIAQLLTSATRRQQGARLKNASEGFSSPGDAPPPLANAQRLQRGVRSDSNSNSDSDKSDAMSKEVTTTLSRFVSTRNSEREDLTKEAFDDASPVDYNKLAQEEDYDENGNLIRRRQLASVPPRKGARSDADSDAGDQTSSPIFGELLRSASLRHIRASSRVPQQPTQTPPSPSPPPKVSAPVGVGGASATAPPRRAAAAAARRQAINSGNDGELLLETFDRAGLI